MTVILLLLVFILLILAIVWGHFLARQKIANDEPQVRDNTNVELYKEHKAEIEADFQQQKIDEESYQYLLTELDKGLLQDMEENQQASVKTSNNLSIAWPIILSIFIFAFSFFLYQKNGAFEQLSQPKVEGQQQQLTQEQMEMVNYIQQLQKQVQQEPNNSDLWFELGNNLMSIGLMEQAVSAFQKCITLSGEKIEYLAAKAQALYLHEQYKITTEVQTLVTKVLSAEPTNFSMNLLLGLDSFRNNNMAKAIEHFSVIKDSGNGQFFPQLEQYLTEAKRRAGMAEPAQPTAAANGPQVKLAVTMSEEILEKMNQLDDRVVFIYAQPANGGRMPLAVVKMRASDLPTRVVLDDSQAMTPQMSISKFEQVNVLAVISKAGTPGVKAGDFKGQINNVNVSDSSETIQLVIDTVVQ